MTKQLEAYIAELQKVINGPNGGLWAHGPAVSALIAALEQAHKQNARDSQRIFEIEADLADRNGVILEQAKRIAELEASHKKLREAMAGIHNTIRIDGANTSLAVILSAAKRAHEESATIAPLEASPLAVKLPAEGTDYKSLVMQLAEIVHGGPVDIGLLPVTVRSMQQLCAAPKMQGWISVDEKLPDPNSNKRICAYTPSEYGDFQYRSVPASLFKSVCSQATHWHYFTVPGSAIAAAPSPTFTVTEGVTIAGRVFTEGETLDGTPKQEPAVKK
jgi:hypothetical protein